MPRRGSVGDVAGKRREDDGGAGVGGEEGGGLGLDLGGGEADAVFEDEGEDGDHEAVEEEILVGLLNGLRRERKSRKKQVVGSSALHWREGRKKKKKGVSAWEVCVLDLT